MSIQRKGSRLITVDGVEYRWVVSEYIGYKNLNVQHASGNGQHLSAVTAYGSANFADVAIQPSHVALVITNALADGWMPLLDGRPLFRSDGLEGIEA